MAEVARLVGVEEREYMKDGKPQRYVGLHMVHVEGSVEDVKGCKVEVLSCPQRLDSGSLKMGGLYQLDYQIFNTKNGKGARLSGLIPVNEK